MELENSNRRNLPGCGRPLKGCAVVFGLIFLLFVVFMFWMFKNPNIQGILNCRNNMEEVSAAISRYHQATGEYPPNLEALKTEYLRSARVLRCPLDKSRSDEPSYIYHRPSSKDKDDFIVLECDRHKLRSDFPLSRLLCLKDGSFKMINPSYKETLQNERMNQKGNNN